MPRLTGLNRTNISNKPCENNSLPIKLIGNQFRLFTVKIGNNFTHILSHS